MGLSSKLGLGYDDLFLERKELGEMRIGWFGWLIVKTAAENGIEAVNFWPFVVIAHAKTTASTRIDSPCFGKQWFENDAMVLSCPLVGKLLKVI